MCMLCACETVDISGGAEAQKGEEGALYASAIAFPEGYDWRKDSLGGGISASLLLFRDKEEILKTAMPGTIPSNIGRVVIAGGQVYSEHFDRKGGFLCRDGKELLRLESGWLLHSICVQDSLFTLETGPEQQWRMRRNGKDVACGNGTIIGTLYEDGGDICFAYSGKGGCFFAENGEPEFIPPVKGMEDILCVRRIDGQMHILGRNGSQGKLYLKSGDAAAKAAYPGSFTSIRDCSILNVDGEAVIHFQIPEGGNPAGDDNGAGQSCWNDVFCKNGKILDRTSGTEQAVAVCDRCAELCFAGSPYGTAGPVAIQFSGGRFCGELDCRMYSQSALCCTADSFFAGMNDASNAYRPVITSLSETVEYDFNGYFTALVHP